MIERKGSLLFWFLLAVQVAGAAAILWEGLPVYRRLLSAPETDAKTESLVVACVTVVAMQLAYWLSHRLYPRMKFRRRPVLAHLLLWLGELSYFFPHALAALCLFDRFEELEKSRYFPERLVLLGAILFTMYCFKRQLELLAEAFSGSESENQQRE